MPPDGLIGGAQQAPPDRPDLAALTGVRSGKRSYYRAYVRSDERMQRAVRAMDSISRALVRTVQGPRGLLEEVVRAAGSHLEAEWMLLALSDGWLPGARPRFLALGRNQEIVDDDAKLPAFVRRELGAIRAGHATRTNDDMRWVRVPMTLEDASVGSLAGLHGLPDDPEPGDLSVLRILANQAAVSLHTSEQYQAGLALHRRAQRLYDEATEQARDLDEQRQALRAAERRLVLANQRELIAAERTRLARELHDTVTQAVLSAGMAMEIARGESEEFHSAALTGSIVRARDLSSAAVDQLRRAIYALHQAPRDTVSSLPELLQDVADSHAGRLELKVRVQGAEQRLPDDANHEIGRAVGEALFNVTAHSGADRVIVRIGYHPDSLLVSVADNGTGDPVALSRTLRLQRARAVDGRHRGLANIESRTMQLGGRLSFRRARLGGVKLEMRFPLPLPEGDGMISKLLEVTEPPPRQGGD